MNNLQVILLLGAVFPSALLWHVLHLAASGEMAPTSVAIQVVLLIGQICCLIGMIRLYKKGGTP